MILDPVYKAIGHKNRRCNSVMKELEKLEEYIEWQPMSTAPHTGEQILLLLSNDWVVLAYDIDDPDYERYRYWKNNVISIPVEETHPPRDEGDKHLKAIGWRRIRFPGDVDVITGETY